MYYYTIKLRNIIKLRNAKEVFWDVIKYTKKTGRKQIFKTDEYYWTEAETIRSSLSYNDANNLVTILRKLNPYKEKIK